MANCFSNGGNTRVTLLPQLVFGTVPAQGVGSTSILPFVSIDPAAVRATIDDQSLTGNREETSIRIGAESTTLSLEVAHRHSQYDLLVENALFGDWTSDVLEVDSSDHPLTIYVEQLDNSVTRRYQDLLVDTMTLDAQLDSGVTLSFGMIGTAQTLDANADTTPTPVVSGAVNFVHFDGSVSFAGGAIGYVTGINVSLSNSLEPVNVWGQKDAACVGVGRSVVDITLTCQFPSDQMLTAWDDETEAEFEFTLNDLAAGKGETWEFSRCRVLDVSIPVSSSGQVIQTVQIRALRNTVAGQSAIKITRF